MMYAVYFQMGQKKYERVLVNLWANSNSYISISKNWSESFWKALVIFFSGFSLA